MLGQTLNGSVTLGCPGSGCQLFGGSQNSLLLLLMEHSEYVNPDVKQGKHILYSHKIILKVLSLYTIHSVTLSGIYLLHIGLMLLYFKV